MDYPLVQIGDVYLTSDGTDTGEPCRVEIPNLGQLRNAYKGATTQAADGTPYAFVIDAEGGKGTPLNIRVFKLAITDLDDIEEYINDQIAASDTVNLKITSVLGTFDLECLPLFPNFIDIPEVPEDSFVNNLTISLIVKSAN